MRRVLRIVVSVSVCVCLWFGGTKVCQAQYALESTQIMNHAELMLQYAKELQQYQTQLQQYQREIQNTVSAPAYVWQQANQTISSLLSTIDTLQAYEQQAGSLQNYLNQFQAESHYQNSPNFGANGATPQQWNSWEQSRQAGSQARKEANDAMVKGIQSQEVQLKQDAQNLVQIQQQAQNATGRMQAIQAANQLAGNQASQLLQIRALLLAQQNATAAKYEADANKEAQEDAADNHFLQDGWSSNDPGDNTGVNFNGAQ